MGTWWRRIKAAVGNAVTWALGWTVFGVGLGAFMGFGIAGIPFLAYVARLALTVGLAGFFAGGSFALVVGVMERKRTLADLKVGRMALWGALGGMALPSFALLSALVGGSMITVSAMLAVLGLTGVLGAGCSAGSLLLARRAERLELEAGALDELGAGSEP